MAACTVGIPDEHRQYTPEGRMFKNLIPKIFYARLQDGLTFFVDGLGFEVLYQDAGMAVVARDGAKAYIVESPECAALDRPGSGSVSEGLRTQNPT